MKNVINNLKMLFRFIRIAAIHLFVFNTKHFTCKKLLILAPHPDDETFGCGELIAECSAAKKEVYVIILSDGTESHRNCCGISPEFLAEKRRNDAFKAMKILGANEENLYFYHLPDGRLSQSLPAQYNDLKKQIESFQCDTLLVPHPEEGWADHLAVTQIGENLAESLQMKLYYYCIWFYFSMPFRRFKMVKWKKARFVHSSDTYRKKCAACNIYLKNAASCGKPYAGVLPNELIAAVMSKKELYFEQ